MKKKGIVLIGGGGHCKVVIETLRASNGLEIAGIVDAERPIGEKVEGVPVIGRDSDLPKIFRDGISAAFIAVGSVGDTKVRRKIAERLTGFSFPTVIHPSAQIASSAKVASGTLVAAGAVIQAGSKIGEHAIINTGAIVDHDCSLGHFVHIAPGAVLSGGVTVGDDTHIGTGSRVIESRKIGRGCLIGAGSVVVDDIPDDSKAFGNPCKVKSS
jgi:sugar O-acyltransferase (sialic acid O-acetyltransferase NeuD family)